MVSLTIAGTERKTVVDFQSLRRTNKINESADTLTFTIKKGGDKTYSPSVHDEVIFTVDGTKEFGGIIVRIKERLLAHKLIEYTVTCKDFAHTLDRELITETYSNTTVDAIIADIIANYTTGFTGNNVDAPQAVERIVFNRVTPSEALAKLAEKANYSWYVDYDKDVHFFSKNNEPAPFNLTDDEASGDYGKYIYKSLEKEDDISQIRNTILVEGGEKVGAERTVTRTSGDVSSEGVLDLEYKFSEKPAVKVDGATQTVGIDYLDDDGSFDVMWNFNEKYLRFTSGNIPVAGDSAVDSIAITGTPLIPIIVNVPDSASVAEFGTFEFAVKDRTIRSEDEAIDRATAEIQAYANSIVDGGFETNESGLRAGQVLQITDSFRSIDEKVLIQSVQLRCITPTGDRLIHKVKFATYKSIGIIEFLQKQLRGGEINEQLLETLLEYLQITDSFSASDTEPTFTKITGPYYWSPVTGSNQGFKWNFGKWS